CLAFRVGDAAPQDIGSQRYLPVGGTSLADRCRSGLVPGRRDRHIHLIGGGAECCRASGIGGNSLTAIRNGRLRNALPTESVRDVDSELGAGRQFGHDEGGENEQSRDREQRDTHWPRRSGPALWLT